MRLLAFSGTRYAADAGDLQDLAAPPFDQIDNELRDQLQGASAHQFAHLTRPIPGPEGDPHRHAAAVYERWKAKGVLAVDEQPSLYPYAIELPDHSQRLGLCGLVGVEPGSEGGLRPHELTVAKPLADRLALLETLRVDLEPVMYIVEDDGSLDAMIAADVTAEPLGSHRDTHGNTHRIYRTADPERIAAYQKLLAPASSVIADGHHRTKTAQLFARKHSPGLETAASAKMAVMISLASEALAIDPIHRAVCIDVDLKALAAIPATRTSLARQCGPEIAAAVAAAPQPALALWPRGGEPTLLVLDGSAAPAGMPGNDTHLPVVLLHYWLLPAAGLPIETATDGSILYRSDPETLGEMAADGSCQLAVWLPPMSPASFAAATAGGQVLPAKSTRFLPKVASGLVWSEHTTQVL